MNPLSNHTRLLAILTTGILNLTVPIQAAPWDKLKNAISEKISTQEDDLTMEELWGQRELKEFAALNSMYTKSGNAEAHEKAEARTETPVRQLRGVYTFIKKIKKYDVGTYEEFSSITEATYWARRVLTIHQTEEAQNEYKKYKKRHGFYY